MIIEEKYLLILAEYTYVYIMSIVSFGHRDVQTNQTLEGC